MVVGILIGIGLMMAVWVLLGSLDAHLRFHRRRLARRNDLFR